MGGVLRCGSGTHDRLTVRADGIPLDSYALRC